MAWEIDNCQKTHQNRHLFIEEKDRDQYVRLAKEAPEVLLSIRPRPILIDEWPGKNEKHTGTGRIAKRTMRTMSFYERGG